MDNPNAHFTVSAITADDAIGIVILLALTAAAVAFGWGLRR